MTVGKSHQMGLTSFDKLSMEKKKSIKWIKPTAKRTIRAREKRNQLRQRQRIKVKKKLLNELHGFHFAMEQRNKRGTMLN